MKYENFLHEPDRPELPIPDSKRVLVSLRLVITRCAMIVLIVMFFASDAGKTAVQHIFRNHHINSLSEVKKQFCTVFGL